MIEVCEMWEARKANRVLGRWNTKRDGEYKAEQDKMYGMFLEIVKEKAPQILKDMEPTPEQETMQAVQSYIRAIVEVCPRGQCADKVDSWRAVVEENLKAFGV